MAAAGGSWSKGTFRPAKGSTQVDTGPVLGMGELSFDIDDDTRERSPLAEAAERDLQKSMAVSWKKQLSTDEKDAIEVWAAGNVDLAYKQINAYARGEIDGNTLLADGSRVGDRAVHLESALQKASTPISIVSYRGTTLSEIAGWSVGDVRETTGFAASTLYKDWGSFFAKKALIRMNVPKGSKAGYITSVIQWSSEAELLLPPRTRFRVRSIQQEAGNTVVDIDIEP